MSYHLPSLPSFHSLYPDAVLHFPSPVSNTKHIPSVLPPPHPGSCSFGCDTEHNSPVLPLRIQPPTHSHLLHLPAGVCDTTNSPPVFCPLLWLWVTLTHAPVLSPTPLVSACNTEHTPLVLSSTLPSLVHSFGAPIAPMCQTKHIPQSCLPWEQLFLPDYLQRYFQVPTVLLCPLAQSKQTSIGVCVRGDGGGVLEIAAIGRLLLPSIHLLDFVLKANISL